MSSPKGGEKVAKSKRLQKKQRKQHAAAPLRQAGLKEKEIKRIVSPTTTIQETEKLAKDIQKQQRKEALSVRSKRLYNQLIKEGVPPKEAAKLKTSQKRVDEYLSQRRQRYVEERLIQTTPAYLVVGYKDVTEETDNEAWFFMKQSSKTRSTSKLEQSIIGWLSSAENQGFIGGYDMKITYDLHQDVSFLESKGYVIAYKGQGLYYKPLLALVNHMGFMLYTVEDKDEFLRDLIEHLRMLPYEKAHENADKLEKNIQDKIGEMTSNHF
jgi:hypothetical protein